MKQFILTCIATCLLISNAYALTINVQNLTDGTIQIMPDQIAQQALEGIVGAPNPFTAILQGRVSQEVTDRIQRALEVSTKLTYNAGESGITSFSFCPLKIYVKKISGANSGKSIPFWTNSNCGTITLTITNTPDGMALNVH